MTINKTEEEGSTLILAGGQTGHDIFLAPELETEIKSTDGVEKADTGYGELGISLLGRCVLFWAHRKMNRRSMAVNTTSTICIRCEF